MNWRRGRNKQEVPEAFRSTSNSPKQRVPEEVREPPREERPKYEDPIEFSPQEFFKEERPDDEDEDKLDTLEDLDLNTSIEEKLKELQKENGSEENPLDGEEKGKGITYPATDFRDFNAGEG